MPQRHQVRNAAEIQVQGYLLENVTATAANIEEFHTGLSTSLLRLEEHCILRLALRASLVGPRKSWIRSNILRDTSGLTNSVVEHVAEDAGGGCFFGVLACSAGEL